jgi:hypothetical protein
VARQAIEGCVGAGLDALAIGTDARLAVEAAAAAASEEPTVEIG